MKRGVKEDTETTPQYKRQQRNWRYRNSKDQAEATTTATEKPRGGPARAPRKKAQTKLEKTSPAKTPAKTRIIVPASLSQGKAFLYLQDPKRQTDPHAVQEEMWDWCWRCFAEEERRITPPYDHAPWCTRHGFEEHREGGPNDPFIHQDPGQDHYH